jgi:hypothetical protein
MAEPREIGLMPPIDEIIAKALGEVRTEALDLSFGEIVSLFSSKELSIPDYQRFFRWSTEQRSRLIESILLELPIPQIFVLENEEGVFELIDGLQRLSSVIQFIQSDLLRLEPLRLDGCDLIPALNGSSFDDLPTKLRLRIKRSAVRAVVIKRQSTSNLRYAMFKRLNTGGSELSEQEIRNCTSRMAGPEGVTFYEFLRKCAQIESFQTCTSTLAESVRDQRGDEELVLRFLALKNGRDLFKGSVRDWLDDYMETAVFHKRDFDYENESKDFRSLFDYLSAVMGEYAFVRFRGPKPVGGLAPAYFEAISLGTWNLLKRIRNIDPKRVEQKLIETVQTPEFRSNVGSGSNSLTKFNARIALIETALAELEL